MKRKFLLKITVFIIISLILVWRLFLVSSSPEEIAHNFFYAFYNVNSGTLNNVSEEGIIQYVRENYAKFTTAEFQESFLLGNRYVLIPMDFAAQNNVHLNCGDIELSNMQEEKFDLYYTFSVEVFFSETLNGEDSYINKGQIHFKKSLLGFKIADILFYDDKFIK